MKKAAKGQRKSLQNKYLSLFILLLSFGLAHGQITYTPMTAAGYQFKYLKGDSLVTVPFKDTTLGRGTTRPGSIVCNSSDTLLYYWNGRKWNLIGSGTGSVVVSDSTQDLQSVTDVGNTTTNAVISSNSFSVIGDDSQLNQVAVTSPTKGTINLNIPLSGNPALSYTLPGFTQTNILADNANGKTLQFPNGNGTLGLTVNGHAADVNGNIIDTLFKTDTAYLTTIINNIFHDSIVAQGPDTTLLIRPLRALNDSTEYLDTFHMPQLRYINATRDTTLWTDTTLIDRKYLRDRLAGLGGGGGGGTLQDAYDASVTATDNPMIDLGTVDNPLTIGGTDGHSSALTVALAGDNSTLATTRAGYFLNEVTDLTSTFATNIAVEGRSTGSNVSVGVLGFGDYIGVSGTGPFFGVYAQSTGGLGLFAQSTAIEAAQFETQLSTGTTVTPIISLRRSSTTSPSAGEGGSIDFNLTSQGISGLSSHMSNQIISKWLNVNDATLASQFEIWGTNAGTTARQLAITPTGDLILDAIQNFAGNAAAISGGLATGTIYRNGDVLQIVH